MSVARKLAFDVGLFDEGFISNAHREETDLSLRVRRYGFQIKCDPGPLSFIFPNPMVERVQTIRTTRGITITSSITIAHTSTHRVFRTNSCPCTYTRVWG